MPALLWLHRARVEQAEQLSSPRLRTSLPILNLVGQPQRPPGFTHTFFRELSRALHLLGLTPTKSYFVSQRHTFSLRSGSTWLRLPNFANAKGGRILPLSYGVSADLPYISSFTNASCINPPFIHTRLISSADADSAIYNTTTCRQFSVSVFTVDYDAPLQCHSSPDERCLLELLVQYANSPSLVGGLNSTTGVNHSEW
jgi:hypothetical protein